MEPVQTSKYVIDTCYNHICRLIFLDEASPNLYFEECKCVRFVKTIVYLMICHRHILGKKAFKLKCEYANYRITTETGAPIPRNRFLNVIQACGGYLKAHLWINNTDSESPMVTPNVSP